MKIISGKELARLLEKRGWQLVRINGSHHVYLKRGSPLRVSIPVHSNRALKIGLQKHLMKLAEIHENEL